MERIKQMNLKKALFTIACINIMIALILSLLAFWGCVALGSRFVTERIVIDIHSVPFLITRTSEPAAQADTAAEIISLVQIILPILIFTTALFATASIFYRLKLKEPLTELTKGAARIIENDLDFTIEAKSQDELGQLCIAFETMRKTLLENNRELWRQAEERRRLNAAFSHNLRNPVTVLKGSLKLVRKGAAVSEHLSSMESYTDRIERYIETMSSIQKLEEIPVEREPVPWETLILELENMIRLMGADSGKQISFCTDVHSGRTDSVVLVDKSILFQIAENLLSNALRFAVRNIAVDCSANENLLELSVTDDGSGFSAPLIKNGIQPFQKGNGDTEHFGIGLYICNLLCEKHGGSISVRNHDMGASVSASLKIQ